jgi:hypothetical protein
MIRSAEPIPDPDTTSRPRQPGNGQRRPQNDLETAVLAVLAPDSARDHETSYMYSLPSIVMSVRNSLLSAEIGCAGVVVGAGLRPVAARVYGRLMAGSSGVPQRSIAVMSLAGWQIAGRMARHAMRRASCPRCPRAASRFAGVGPASGQWRDRGRTARTGPAVPVPGRPGIFGGGERWPCRSDF